jgi:hypothetical protein
VVAFLWAGGGQKIDGSRIVDSAVQLGMHMRELWGQKAGFAIALAIATLAATRVLFGFSLLPPKLERNSQGLASASTQVVIDTPRSSIIDLREDTYSFTGLTNRSLLLGNVMASLPVREYIARRAGVPAAAIRVSAPLTPEQPRVVADGAHQPKTSDILRSPDEYRLSVQANPTVPVLDIYAEAPDGPAAGRLANAAVEGLHDYLGALARRHGTPLGKQVRLVQLGRASGATIDSGAGITLAALVFTFVFTIASAAVLFIARVRRGWATSEGPSPSPHVG